MTIMTRRAAAPTIASDKPDDWREEALCREVDPELFFPVGNHGPAAIQAEEAKRICLRCPSRVPCLKWAVDNSIDDGVWGGTTEHERRWAKRQAVA